RFDNRNAESGLHPLSLRLRSRYGSHHHPPTDFETKYIRSSPSSLLSNTSKRAESVPFNRIHRIRPCTTWHYLLCNHYTFSLYSHGAIIDTSNGFHLHILKA